jgi:hypothetical protein
MTRLPPTFWFVTIAQRTFLPFRGKVVFTQVRCGRRSTADVAESRQLPPAGAGIEEFLPFPNLGRSDAVLIALPLRKGAVTPERSSASLLEGRFRPTGAMQRASADPAPNALGGGRGSWRRSRRSDHHRGLNSGRSASNVTNISHEHLIEAAKLGQ